MVAIDVEDDGGSGGDFVPEPQGPPWVYRFHHVDHLGSTRVETDEMAHALATHAYYPYGTEIPPLQVSDNSHRFAGHERDNATSLDYMHARYYAGSLGRFLSTDPAHESVHPGNPQTWNRYSYVVNNPISSVDPDGRAVIGARLETDGLNKIPKPTADHELSIKPSELATLGPKVAPRGFMMGVNTIFVTSPDDKASNYHVGQKAVSFELQDPRTNSWKIVGKGPDKDDSPTPNNQNAQGRVLVSFDGPGGIVPKGVVPNNFTGTLVQYTKTQALAGC
jgi:RHS repeat-associated protein